MADMDVSYILIFFPLILESFFKNFFLIETQK